ncbi:hypothetical protein ACIBAG_33370 [Streptomyces sp. NPDC051243]|uniref:hypothetical protein n=1 Tax=Streptomyces sp. NPDC051243 TaxID=3365646 RepID=UPI00378B40AF
MGGGLAVAEQVAKNPNGVARQAQALVDAVHESFAHAIAQTSLIGAIIMAAGTMIVIAVLPGREATGKHRSAEQVTAGADRDKECAEAARSSGPHPHGTLPGLVGRGRAAVVGRPRPAMWGPALGTDMLIRTCEQHVMRRGGDAGDTGTGPRG